jgi:hypothetical protein
MRDAFEQTACSARRMGQWRGGSSNRQAPSIPVAIGIRARRHNVPQKALAFDAAGPPEQFRISQLLCRNYRTASPDLPGVFSFLGLRHLHREARDPARKTGQSPFAKPSVIGERERLGDKSIGDNPVLVLAFLSPQLVAAILQGGQPAELTATRLTELDLPLDWTEQHKLLASLGSASFTD